MPAGQHNKAKTHCKRGHAFTGDNTHVRRNGSRCCRRCAALQIRANRYGISVDKYLRMMEEQGGLCAVCGAEESALRFGKTTSLAVDHDHETGVVRGLLCGKCNAALGMMDDNPELLRAAADYLDQHNSTTKEV